MNQIEKWMEQIDTGELFLNVEEYEDYSGGYWDSGYVTEYYDNQEIGDTLHDMIHFARNCVDDGRYKEANSIYEWLWEMYVSTDEEYGEAIDLEMLVENRILQTDLEKLALLTLYADYQVRKPDERAEALYSYFTHYEFCKLHTEDMFRVGREALTETGRFWDGWIELLKAKGGDTEGRLLKEAVLYRNGIEGLVKIADENFQTHPALYLEAMKEYDRSYGYSQIESIGEKALEKLDPRLLIRSKIALKAADASAYLNHKEKMMLFIWEGFCSDSTVRNFLRLFATKEMAEQYGMRAKEILGTLQKGTPVTSLDYSELRQNIVCSDTCQELKFYTGHFKEVKAVSKNPSGSLGWSSSFVGKGIRLFLLYLFEAPLPSEAARAIADRIGFRDDLSGDENAMFEKAVVEESSRHKVSVFWNYFQRWKQYFPMEQQMKVDYLEWAEKIVHSRADAIVGGKHRDHYQEVAILLAMVGEIREQMGEAGARREIFALYKRKFPRHSAFWAEMRRYVQGLGA